MALQMNAILSKFEKHNTSDSGFSFRALYMRQWEKNTLQNANLRIQRLTTKICNTKYQKIDRKKNPLLMMIIHRWGVLLRARTVTTFRSKFIHLIQYRFFFETKCIQTKFEKSCTLHLLFFVFSTHLLYVSIQTAW